MQRILKCFIDSWLFVSNNPPGKNIGMLFSYDWFQRGLRLIPITTIYALMVSQVFSYPCENNSATYKGCCPSSKCLINETICGTTIGSSCTVTESFEIHYIKSCCDKLNGFCDVKFLTITIVIIYGAFLIPLWIMIVDFNFGFQSLYLFCSILPFVKLIIDDKNKHLVSCSGEDWDLDNWTMISNILISIDAFFGFIKSLNGKIVTLNLEFHELRMNEIK